MSGCERQAEARPACGRRSETHRPPSRVLRARTHLSHLDAARAPVRAPLARASVNMGPLSRTLAASPLARVAYASLLFVPTAVFSLLCSFAGQLRLMVLAWRGFSAALGVTSRVHGRPPPRDAPALWVANHFNWFDWPVLQAAAPAQLSAIVKVRRSPGCPLSPRVRRQKLTRRARGRRTWRWRRPWWARCWPS